MNSITYNAEIGDYEVNGKSFLKHLSKHENIEPQSYVPSVLVQPATSERMINSKDPDLIGGHVAIYLCGHCGDYDGQPIGVKITFSDSTVSWDEIGFYSDIDEGVTQPFRKVTTYTFPKDQYMDFIESVKVYEPGSA